MNNHQFYLLKKHQLQQFALIYAYSKLSAWRYFEFCQQPPIGKPPTKRGRPKKTA